MIVNIAKQQTVNKPLEHLHAFRLHFHYLYYTKCSFLDSMCIYHVTFDVKNNTACIGKIQVNIHVAFLFLRKF